MRQASKRVPDSAEKTVRDIRRATRRHHSAEEKIRIVLEGLRGEDSIAELCRKEGINQNLYYRWSKEFLEAGKKRLAGDTVREATSDEVKELKAEARQLKETLAEVLIENRLLKKSVLGEVPTKLAVQPAFDFGVPIEAPITKAEKKPGAPLFAQLDRDGLLSVGVPEDWVDDVRAADDDGFLALTDHLPAEASEALLEYISSGTLKRPALPEPGASPFAHPDTLRRFRVVDNVEELEAALNFPWEKWAVFLHPAQRAIVEQSFLGPVRVAGSAGTGKTVVAIYRAMHHLRASPDSRVLLTTFSDPLANALRDKLRILAGSEPYLLDRVAVTSFLGIAEELHQLAFGKKAHLASREIMRSLVEKARKAANIDGLSSQFVLSEWSNVADAWHRRRRRICHRTAYGAPHTAGRTAARELMASLRERSPGP